MVNEILSLDHSCKHRAQCCNADGVCDSADVAALLGWLRHEPATPVCWSAADLDGSAVLDAVDLARLKRLILMRTQ